MQITTYVVLKNKNTSFVLKIRFMLALHTGACCFAPYWRLYYLEGTHAHIAG